MHSGTDLTPGEFQKIVREAIQTIPQEFLEKLDNVDIVIEDQPTLHQLKRLQLRRGGYHLLGLYEGIPRTKRQNYSSTLPDKITIFKKPIEVMARSIKDLREIVRNVVWHEIAHHFGMDEAAVDRAEQKRRQRLQ